MQLRSRPQGWPLPLVCSHSSTRSGGSYDQQIECGAGSAEAQVQYGAALQDHLKRFVAKDLPLAFGNGATATCCSASQLHSCHRARLPWRGCRMSGPEVAATTLAAGVSRSQAFVQET